MGEDSSSSTTTSFEDEALKSQYAALLTDYSSEYGIGLSGTYDANNIVGIPRHFDPQVFTYGDHVSSLVFRTYGPYWNMMPYHKEYKPIGHQPKWFQASDFIELEFHEPVYPTEIEVYETFCPGGLVRILISDLKTEIPEGTSHLSRWKTIWNGPNFQGPHLYTRYTPKLPKHSKNSIATYRIRLEFNDVLAEYYHELDAVKLVGYPWKKGVKASQYLMNRITEAVSVSVPTKLLKNLSLNDKKKDRKKEEAIKDAGQSNISEPMKVNYFEVLPLEVVQIIISYVCDLKYLIQVARVCQMFHRIVTDGTFIKELNLKPFYTVLKGDNLLYLTSTYANNITKLDLSWTGFKYGYISPYVAAEGLKHLPNLIELKCRNCKDYVDDLFLGTLANHCKNLKFLDLFHCEGFNLFMLTPLVHLEYLDISQCSSVSYQPTPENDKSFFESCQNIKWFLMGRTCYSMFDTNCNALRIESIMLDMLKNCKEIHGVNFWRQRGMGAQFLNLIERFGTTLKYLDLGWTGLQPKTTSSNKQFWRKFQGCCPNLEYLALTSVHISIDDEDLANFGRNCPNLEQLDLLGIRGFSATGLHGLLKGCKSMKFLDLSYGPTSVGTVLHLRAMYPHCDIKHVPTILATNRELRNPQSSSEEENADDG